METLRVLICGGDSTALKQMAQRLSDEGVRVETSTRLIDRLCIPNQEWDLLLIDLDALTSFLRGLLPAVRLQFPNLDVVGISTRTSPDIGFLANDLELDDYLLNTPRTEDLIVRFPRVAANYLCDTNTLSAFGIQSLAA
jgi:DNA-binding response OmpR family regulator